VAQSLPENIYIDFENPSSILQLASVRNLKKVKSVHFDNVHNSKNFVEQINKIKDVVEIDRIIITNCSFKKLPDEISSLQFISAITIIHSDELNLKYTFKQFSELPILDELNLGNNKIEILPKEIGLLTHLTSLNISFNKSIQLKQSIDHIKLCKSLHTLALPVNELSELPENISQIKSLRELNLMNNNITDLPLTLADMDSLEVLYLAKNIIVDPIKTYNKLEKLNIKILSIDEVNDAELKRIESMFPNTKINQERQEEIVELEKHIQPSLTTTAEEPKKFQVIQKSQNTNIKTHSLAYTKYAHTFDPLQKPVQVMDSTLFDERFLDTNYYNVFRHQLGLDYDYFEVKPMRKTVKNQVWFEIKLTTYFYNNFPENKAFTGMVWAIVGNEYNRSEFVKAFVKDQKYTDYRLYYRSDLKNFTLRLKTQSGFKELTVVPRFENKEGSISSVQSSYEKRYVRYLENLDARRKKFNHDQYDRSIKYRMKVNKLNNQVWSDFKKKYFSEEEKELSQEEWLAYYDQVLANERLALRNSVGSKDNIQRYLDLLQIDRALNVEEVKKFKNTQISRFKFVDYEHNDVIITSLIVVNKSLNQYKVYDGSNGLMEFYLFLRQSDDYSIFAMIRNGDMGVVSSLDFSKIVFRQEDANEIEILQFEVDFSVLGDLISAAHL
jgi:hypothetical protein